jgi:hypothetical protein
MSSDELAWVSGIIEGEGSFVSGGRRFGAVRAVMTDQDVIDHLTAVSGVGTVHAIESRQPHHKQAWSWQVVRPPSIASLITGIAPFLLERRHSAASKVLALQDMAIPGRRALRADESWAWTAGLMEGEACFRPSPTARVRHVGITVSSTDRDVVMRLREVTELGSIHEQASRRGWRPIWIWDLNGRDRVGMVIARILPMLGERRSERARYVLGLCGT